MLPAAFGSSSEEPEEGTCELDFSIFFSPIYFNKNDSFRVYSLQAKQNPSRYLCVFSFVLIGTSSECLFTLLNYSATVI